MTSHIKDTKGEQPQYDEQEEEPEDGNDDMAQIEEEQ